MTLKKRPFENIVGIEENAGNQPFLFFPPYFLKHTFLFPLKLGILWYGVKLLNFHYKNKAGFLFVASVTRKDTKSNKPSLSFDNNTASCRFKPHSNSIFSEFFFLWMDHYKKCSFKEDSVQSVFPICNVFSTLEFYILKH